MKQIILFIVFIFTTMTCTFAQNSNSSPTTKVKDEKNSEQILENNKDQFGISSKGIFGKLIKGIVYDAGTREPGKRYRTPSEGSKADAADQSERNG